MSLGFSRLVHLEISRCEEKEQEHRQAALSTCEEESRDHSEMADLFMEAAEWWRSIL